MKLTNVISVGMLLVFGTLPGCGDEASVAATTNGPQARPLQTGQTACYDASGLTPDMIPCAGTKQDGALQKGVARRYIDNGDGTITDASTGLMWEKKGADGSLHDQRNRYNWSDAFSVFIAGLNQASFAGHSDWRLPNVNELQSIANYGTFDLAIDAVFNTSCTARCTVTTCSCTQPDNYWSATTYQQSPTFAWFVSFFGGTAVFNLKLFDSHVRAVRGGP